MLENILGHTVETGLLQPGNWALDAGCLGFGFTNALLDRGLKVVALDPGEKTAPERSGLFFHQAALVGNHSKHFRWEEVGHSAPSSHLVEAENDQVKTYTVQELMQEHGIDRFALIKLDIEGSEYHVLDAISGPIAQQLSVEFHLHLWHFFAKSLVEAEERQVRTYEHLIRWYEPRYYFKQRLPVFDCDNFIDTLFIEKP
jgi:FkbM family methyltransferase